MESSDLLSTGSTILPGSQPLITSHPHSGCGPDQDLSPVAAGLWMPQTSPPIVLRGLPDLGVSSACNLLSGVIAGTVSAPGSRLLSFWAPPGQEHQDPWAPVTHTKPLVSKVCSTTSSLLDSQGRSTVGEGRPPLDGHQFMAGPSMSICGFARLLKGTLAVPF